MDLFDSMRIFVRVVERGSFSAVARELNMGQPAVSKQVRALEQYLGGAVFARSTRHLALTDQGQRFYSHCQEILSQLEHATRSFASGQEQIAGPLRIAAPVSYGRLCIAPLIGAFLQRHPDVQIDLRLNDYNEDLLMENIDLAIRIGLVKSEGLVAVPLGTSTRRVYAAPAYLDRHGQPREPAELAGHNCIAFTLLEHYDRWHFTHRGEALEVAIKGNVTSNNSEAIREMVLGGLGISLSPQWLFAADFEQGGVCSLLDEYQTTALPVSAVFSRERRRSARTMAFIDFLRENV
ncbi:MULTISPECIES: LysR family transcriptional regulator [Pseudomonas]|jgi:DNA-binding transcriptional LysR family regulator|uniref:Transcriptional regulator, LysR family n=2 Tax=Pseudomonas putida group TaxID=136845 RepID=Q88IN8_PSEPK|nr:MULTISPECIES: LysR family transcriptional regulator [Pseudomonas]AAN68569.1 Transcriptional regulator, LysR family [Pseudomonas putida KT2440]KMU97762.1 LysR family transcriptional regulator [Pseudomonas putida]KMY35222.1 LysR family transcriptional regulator [Pseudomonas putida]MBP2840919.1 LysR family transcriptional regulator [Pseudomonas sp. PNP]MCE0860025.1 LysR family transcriptional regulator [Pseudomonas alloputida]